MNLSHMNSSDKNSPELLYSFTNWAGNRDEFGENSISYFDVSNNFSRVQPT